MFCRSPHKFHFCWRYPGFILFYNCPSLHPYKKAGNAKALYIFSIVCFWTWEGFKVLLIIPVIWRNVDILTVIYFSFWYEIEHPRSWKVFICSITLLFIVILLLTGSLPLKATVFVLLFEIFSSLLEVILPSFCIEVCFASSESITITWSSADKES